MRLIQGYNPESGWICYGTTPSNASPNGTNCTEDYDLNGNLLAKTDARGITIGYSFDTLNRLTGKTYTAPNPAPAGYAATAPVSYTYDQGGSQANPIGRRTGMTDASGQQTWTYDQMGRVTNITRSISTPLPRTLTGSAYYRYNLDGTLSAGRFYTSTLFQYTYDTAGRATAVSWNANEADEVFQEVYGASYTAGGLLTGLTMGGGNSGAAV